MTKTRAVLWAATAAAAWSAPVQAAPVVLPAAASAVTAPADVSVTGDGAGFGLDTSALLMGAGDTLVAEQACSGLIIGSVHFDGCPNTPCAPLGVRTQMAMLVDLDVGQRLEPGRIAVAYTRLMQIGYFKALTATCTPDAAGRAQIRFAVTGHHFVRHIDFSGNTSIFEDELRGKLLIQPGDDLDVELNRGKERMLAQKEALETLYRKNGFDGAQVELFVLPDGPGLVRLHITVREGERQRINDTKFEVRPLPPRSEFEETHGLQCPTIGERAIRNIANVQGLDVFSQREANRIRGRIRTYLRQLGYGSARIDVTHEKTDQTVRVEVTPGRCAVVRILARDDSGGVGKGKYQLQEDRDLYDALPFGESGLYDFSESERGRHDLVAALENRGYVFADVRLDFRPVPTAEAGQVSTAITYYVATGYVSQIRGIFFHAADRGGSRADLSDDMLRAQMATRAYDFVDSGGFLQVDQLLADLDQLRQYFVAQGYYQFHYAVTLPEGETPTAANRRQVQTANEFLNITYRFKDKGFRLRKPLQENFIYLDVDYVQGEQTRLRTLTVVGAAQVPEREVRALWPIAPGEPTSAERLDKALTALEESYRNNGFFRTTVKMLCSTSEPSHPEAECKQEHLAARQVDVRLVIEEGERVDFGETFGLGAFNTDWAVLQRDLPQAGVPYSAAAEFEAQRRMRNLGLFSQVSLTRIGDLEKPPRRRLATVVHLVEEQTRYWEALAGFQTINADRANSERDSLQGFKETIDQSSTASDRISAGYGRSQNLTLPNLLATVEGAYVDRNFWHAGKRLRVSAKVGVTAPPDYKDVVYLGDAAAQTANGAIPWYNHNKDQRNPPWYSDTLRYASLSATFEDARLFGSDFSFRAVPYLSHDYAVLAFDTDRAGLLVALSRRFFGWVSAGIAVDGGLIRTREQNARLHDFDGVQTDGAVTQSYFGNFGLQPQLTVTPSLSVDTTDSPLNPRRGYSASLTLPYINAYLRNAETKGAERANFFKIEGTVKGYVPVGDALTFGVMLHAGQVSKPDLENCPIGQTTCTQKQIPDFVLFRLGGQYAQTLLRGYSDYGLRQYYPNGSAKIFDGKGNLRPVGSSPYLDGDHTQHTGNIVANGTVELRFPVLRASNVYGALHWDFGALLDNWGELAGDTVRHGLGVSGVFLLSGQIPVRFDLAFRLGASRCQDVAYAGGKLDCPINAEERSKTNWGMSWAF